jgi:hypothetical protein
MFSACVFLGVFLYWFYNLCKIITNYIEYIIQCEFIDDTRLIFHHKINIVPINCILSLLLLTNDIYHIILFFIYIVNVTQFYINYRYYNRTLFTFDYVILLFLHIIILYIFFNITSNASPIIYISSCIIIGLF